MQASYLFLNCQLKGYCQEWQKYVGSPKTHETQLSMQILAAYTIHCTNIGNISNTLHVSPPIMYNKSAY